MHAYRLESPDGPSSLAKVQLPVPSPGRGEVVIDVKASSLNFRDLIMCRGKYPGAVNYPLVPCSDAAGVVTAVGEGVTKWAVGDRVMPNFMRDWVGGEISAQHQDSALGGAIDGVLAEQICMPDYSLVRVPEHLSFAEAATLPCAAVTAWNALAGSGMKAGDTVLLLGTGGVSIFGLQLAHAAGCTTIVTSSSDDKLEQAKALGATHTINYKTNENWHEQVIELTGGRGADMVPEVSGVTLNQSMQAIRVGGHIAVIGLLARPDSPPNMLNVLHKAQHVRGIYVGSVELFEQLTRAVEANHLKPVIDKSFAFDDAVGAFEYFASRQHVGKIVIEQ